MEIGHHIMAWRRANGLTQDEAARRAGLTRPYLSRLEGGGADPALSSLRRLAVALGVGVGKLIEELPPPASFDRFALDRLARGALRPGTKEVRADQDVRALSRMVKDRRRALGLYRPRKPSSPPGPSGRHAIRWLRARLGEAQWNALLSRIDKLAGAHAR